MSSSFGTYSPRHWEPVDVGLWERSDGVTCTFTKDEYGHGYWLIENLPCGSSARDAGHMAAVSVMQGVDQAYPRLAKLTKVRLMAIS